MSCGPLKQKKSSSWAAAFMGLFTWAKSADDCSKEPAKSEEPEMEPGSKEEAGLSSSRDPHAWLLSILQHQQFDGLFLLNSSVAALFFTTVKELQGNLAELQKAKGVEISETEWATCLAVELMRKQLPELLEEWELVVEKAEKRVAALVTSAEDLAALKQAATDMVHPVTSLKAEN